MASRPLHVLKLSDTIDPTKPHAKAMKLLEEAGIHIVLVSTP